MVGIPYDTDLIREAGKQGIEHLQKMMGNRRGAPWTPERVLAHKDPSQRKRYKAAYDTLKTDPIRTDDFKVEAFIKFEKWFADEIEEKKPRMIQFRNPRYTNQRANERKPNAML